MSSQYVNITATEMRNFLRADKGWTEFNGQAREFVYVSPIRFLPNNAVLKVYTGISKHDDQSRRKGIDAIRVCVVEDGGHGRGLMATSHVKRVINWKANLVNRITETIRELKRRNPQPQPMTDKQAMGHLMTLASRLSPENLYADGNNDHSQAEAARQKIMAEWRQIEAQLGREITTDEVFGWLSEDPREQPFDGEEEYDRQQDELERRWRAGPL